MCGLILKMPARGLTLAIGLPFSGAADEKAATIEPRQAMLF
jgi:hypothetical protein